MRLVQITVPSGKREAIRSVLDDEEIDYVLTEEAGDSDVTAVVTFPLPPNAIEPVLEDLREAGLPSDAYTIILNAESVVSPRYEALVERYAEDEEATDRIARTEVKARAADLAPTLTTYVAMTTLSILIATAGVLLDSAAVVVGSMVIAPLIGPAMATSVGTVLQDRDLFSRGVRLQVIGFALSAVAAAIFAWLLRSTLLVPLTPEEVIALGEVRERLAPDFLSLAVALAAGSAGAYSLSSGVSSSLVGVAIAIALVPPTAVIGIGIAWGLPAVVFGSTVLVLVNFASINLAALALLWYQGYRPENWFQEDVAQSATIKRIGVLVAAILVLSVPLGVATYSSYQASAIEGEVRTATGGVLDDPAYEDVVLVEIAIERGGFAFVAQPERVVLTLGRPPGERYPDLADRLADRINAGGRDLAVEVRYLEIQVRTSG